MKISYPKAQTPQWLAAVFGGICLLLLSGQVLAQTAETLEKGEISRAQFSSLVADREPVDSLTSATTDIGKLYFFTEVNDMAGKVIIHRWRYFDETVAEIPFSIDGPRWRVNSYKNLQTSMAGEWSVELVDDKGKLYGEHSILVAEGNNEPASEGIDRIRTLFPDSQYVLVNDSLTNGICPPGGAFKWQQQPNQLWTLEMGERQHIRVRTSNEDTVALQPDPGFTLPDSNCLMYSGHSFDEAKAELVTDLQTDCEGESNDVFSARSLRRHDNFVDLTIYAEELAVCRYRIN